MFIWKVFSIFYFISHFTFSMFIVHINSHDFSCCNYRFSFFFDISFLWVNSPCRKQSCREYQLFIKVEVFSAIYLLHTKLLSPVSIFAYERGIVVIEMSMHCRIISMAETAITAHHFMQRFALLSHYSINLYTHRDGYFPTLIFLHLSSSDYFDSLFAWVSILPLTPS